MKMATEPASTAKKRVWIDLDNSPHVPFFIPITRELEARGYDVILTARDAYQVSDLVEFFGLRCEKIGRHFGKNKFLKVLGVCSRALHLMPFLSRSGQTWLFRMDRERKCLLLLCWESPVW